MSSRRFYRNPVFIVGMFYDRKRNTGLKKKLKQFRERRRYIFFFNSGSMSNSNKNIPAGSVD